jgi:peptidoglycan hydrolase-like protein with peptidoglycan-binding domain
MKSDLIISRYKTEKIIGTKSSYDSRTFFGSKMIDIEDSITVDDRLIQYSEVFDTVDKRNNGYQYYNDLDNIEKIYLVSLFDVKNDNHTITLDSQNRIDLRLNTQWTILINWRDILIRYIYLKLKEARTFKTIKFDNVLSENINLYIRKYIVNNLISRYGFDSINFYIKYFDLDDGDEEKDPNLVFDPIFDASIKSEENRIKNVNSTLFPEILNVKYKQTESSQFKKFHYYFDLIINKV